MKRYENFRENGKRCYFADPIFEGNAPVAKVISYFVKKSSSKTQQETPSEDKTVKVDDYTYNQKCCLKWARERLKKTLQYKRKWYGDQDIYKFVALQNYLDQCEAGGYSKCLLSWQEVYMIKEKKKSSKEKT